eukprot:sb/3474333/
MAATSQKLQPEIDIFHCVRLSCPVNFVKTDRTKKACPAAGPDCPVVYCYSVSATNWVWDTRDESVKTEVIRYLQLIGYGIREAPIPNNFTDSSLISHTQLAVDTESLHRFVSRIPYPIGCRYRITSPIPAINCSHKLQP